MTNLTKMVIDYKKNKDNNLLENILKTINKDINKRVEIIYKKLKYYQIEKDDIRQELYIKILNIIENYDTKCPFENYLFYSLKFWKPKLKKDDIINFESLYKIDETTGEELEIEIEDKKSNKTISNFTLEAIFKECQNELEIKICKTYLENPKITEEELAEKLGTYQKNISRVINRLRKRLKKFV